MSDPKPRAWKYMGDNLHDDDYGRHLRAGDHYMAVVPLTPEDVELVPPVEVTAEDVVAVFRGLGFLRYEDAEMRLFAAALTERLASRQEGGQ